MSTKNNDRTPADQTPENKPEDENVTPAETAGQTAEATKPSPKAEETKPSQDEELKAEKDKYLRLLAEYDNYRKRSAKERENIYSDVRADTVVKFLPVYDNLVRALAHPTEDEAYRRGVEMIMAQFCEILSALGVSEIDTLGKRFDPKLHEAIVHEGDETKGECEIAQEFRKGFKMGDKVIRFAMVKVTN